MAVSKKISELPVLISPDAADLLPVVDVTDGVTKQTTVGSTAVYNQGGPGAVDRTVEFRLRDLLSVVDKGAVNVTGTDNEVAIQAAIDDGAGDVIFPDGTFDIGATVTLKSNAVLRLGANTTIKWTGAAGGTMFTTPSDDVLNQTGILGGTIDMVDAGFLLDGHSFVFSEFGNFEVLGNRTTSFVFRCSADSTAGSPPGHVTKTQSFSNSYHDIHHSGENLGTFMQLRVNKALSNHYFISLKNLQGDQVNVCGLRFTGADNVRGDGLLSFELPTDGARGLICEQDSVSSGEATEILLDYFNADGFTNTGGASDRVGIELKDITDIFRVGYYITGGLGITGDLTVASTVKRYAFGGSRFAAVFGHIREVGSGSGPLIQLERQDGEAQLEFFNSEDTPSGGIARLKFQAKDDAGNKTDYATIVAAVDDDTNGSEDGGINFQTFVAGIDTKVMTLKDGSVIIGSTQLADAATDGFLYLPTTTAGAPSGTPTTQKGGAVVPMVVDDTNQVLYIFIGAAWRKLSMFAGAAVADASGGGTVDSEARTAINALLARLRTNGIIAT